MNNQSVILSKDITSGDITPLISSGNVLLTSRPSLNQLTNVTITTPTDNQVLTYDAGGDLWYNADSQGGGGGGGGGGDNDFLSYSVNYVPLNATLFTSGNYFSVLDSVNMSQTPNPPIIRFNNSNNLTLTNGIITGLSPTKYYEVDFNIYIRTMGTASTGLWNIGLYNGSVETGSIISLNQITAPGQLYRPIGYNNIITGYSNINPVLAFLNASSIILMTTTDAFCVNIVVKEVNGGGGGGATTLTALTDVNITTPAEGEALTYNATTTKWENSVIVSKTELNQLDDVDITTPTNGQYLQYDTSLTPPKWVNKTPSYLSYSLNAYPLNEKFTAQSFFSIFATSTFNETPAPVYNYNFSNGITLSTATGLITGLDATKTYMIDFYLMKVATGSSNGLHTLSLFTDAPDAIPAGTAIILNTSVNGGAVSSQGCYTLRLDAIITGQTQICPVLKYNFFGSAINYTGLTNTAGFNATINIREL